MIEFDFELRYFEEIENDIESANFSIMNKAQILTQKNVLQKP